MDSNVKKIVESSRCGAHSASEGVSCWGIYTSSGTVLSAICNKRAKRAGYTGQITPGAIRKTVRG